ncbi:hypothetical protein [Vibrio rotiferianus]|uniref:hypothetical protein n=1 Tax=Vibrio rotiferianus TaxID=190895 RepID=UPI00406A23B4
MCINLLDPIDKKLLWRVKQLGGDFYIQKADSDDQNWQLETVEDICRYFGYSSWFTLKKAKLSTMPFKGWQGFGYRKSAYSTWLVHGYLTKNNDLNNKINQLFLVSQQLGSQPSLDSLSIKVQRIVEDAFQGISSFSSYADVEMVNWQELILKWNK